MSADETPRDAVPLSLCDPADWLARLARADELLDQGDYAGSYLTRARGFLWAWANAHSPAHKLCFVEGRGRQPLVAHFLAFEMLEATRRVLGWDEANYLEHALAPAPGGGGLHARLIFESPGHDVPADVGRQRWRGRLSVDQINAGTCPWLLPTRHGGLVALEHGDADRCGVTGREVEPGGPVMAGDTVAEFCAAVERAGGWWLPLGG